MMRPLRYTTIAVLAVVLSASTACRSSSAEDNQPRDESSSESHHSGSDHHDSHHESSASNEESEHDHGHADSHFHLAPKMVVLSRRFSAIWFAGLKGNHQMVHYQAHELEELLAEIKQASPTENGIDVARRLQSDVISKLEGLETATKDGETDTFRKSYKQVVQRCSGCHADTGHDYLNVTIPTRNPYPNMSLGGDQASGAQDDQTD